MEVFWHILDCVVGIASLLAILDYFGVRKDHPMWGLRMPLNRKWKLGVMLILVSASMGMSVYAFIRAYRPKIVEKTVTVTVEKPVEKIVEKVVPAKCPKPPECQKPQTTSGQQPQQPVIPPGSNITATTNAPDSAAVGVNTGTVTVNPPTNPNADVVVYDCIGRKTSMKHVGINLEFNMASADSPQQPYIDTMVKLANSGKSAELLEKCTERKNAEAGWLTPYLFCAVAQLGLGHMDEAKREFQYYDSRKGGSYEGDGLCSQLVNAVQARLK